MAAAALLKYLNHFKLMQWEVISEVLLIKYNFMYATGIWWYIA